MGPFDKVFVMRNPGLLPTGLIAAALFAAPLLAEPFPGSLDRDYGGAMTVEVFPADGGARVHRDRGTATLIFTQDTENAVNIAITGEVADSGGFEVSMLLAGDGGTWRSGPAEGIMQIDGAGRLLSVSVIDGFETIWTGQITAQTASLTLRRFPTPEAPQDQREFATVFTLELATPADEPPETVEAADDGDGDGDGDGDCARIEWRLVNRWNPFGGGLSLSREPFCVH